MPKLFYNKSEVCIYMAKIQNTLTTIISTAHSVIDGHSCQAQGSMYHIVPVWLYLDKAYMQGQSTNN